MELLWSHEALDQLVEIEDFISKDSPERAADFVDGIVRHVEDTLPPHPQIGRVVPEILNPEIRELVYRGYRIIYRLTSTGIYILTVFEGHRLLRLDEMDR